MPKNLTDFTFYLYVLQRPYLRLDGVYATSGVHEKVGRDYMRSVIDALF